MNKHIRKNFRYPEIAQEMGIQGRVYVNFIIAKDGQITNIRMRGPDKNLENEAERIVSLLWGESMCWGRLLFVRYRRVKVLLLLGRVENAA